MSLKRENWIDWAKTIGILLVVMGHTQLGGGPDRPYTTFIYAFHMPLFFIVSGYLFTPIPAGSSYKGFLRKNAKALLSPYFIFEFLGFFLAIAQAALVSLKSGAGFGVDHVLVWKYLGGIFLGVEYTKGLVEMPITPLWFLLALFFVRVIYARISSYGFFVKVGICIVAVSIVVFLASFGLFLPFSLGSALLALPFYFAGHLLKEKGIFTGLKSRFFMDGALFAVSLAVLLLSVKFNTGITDMSNCMYNNLFMFFTGAFSGSMMVFSLCFMLEKVHLKFVTTISIGTLLIMALHLYGFTIQGVVFNIISRATGWEYHPTLLAGTVISLAIVSVFYPVILFCQKHCPILLGRPKRSSVK